MDGCYIYIFWANGKCVDEVLNNTNTNLTIWKTSFCNNSLMVLMAAATAAAASERQAIRDEQKQTVYLVLSVLMIVLLIISTIICSTMCIVIYKLHCENFVSLGVWMWHSFPSIGHSIAHLFFSPLRLRHLFLLVRWKFSSFQHVRMRCTKK